MYEYHIEYSDISHCVLYPELIIAESCRTRVGYYRGHDKSKYGSREEPEIANIKEGLVFSDHHVASENDTPSAHRNGKVVNGCRSEGGQTDKAPEV